MAHATSTAYDGALVFVSLVKHKWGLKRLGAQVGITNLATGTDPGKTVVVFIAVVEEE